MKCRYGIAPEYSGGCCCEACRQGKDATQQQFQRMQEFANLWHEACVDLWKVAVINEPGTLNYTFLITDKESRNHE